MKEFLQKLIRKENLTRAEAANAVEQMHEADPHQVAAFLALLRAKGETSEEIGGFIESMQKNMVKIDIPDAMDIVGTGGDGKKTVNISTAAAILAAASGVKIVKHGSVAHSSSSGSADVLRALGISHLENFTFCFAPLYHPMLAKMKEVRKKLSIPTTLNIIAPLLNPAQVKYCMMGVFDEKLIPLAVDALLQMKMKRAYVFHGCGYDELTTVGPAQVVEIHEGKTRSFVLDPKTYGFSYCDPKELEGGTPEENATKIRAVFAGTLTGGLADTIILNAGVAIYLFGLVKTIEEGIDLAKKNLSRAGKNFLQEIVEHKKREIEALKRTGFKGGVIAEIKRRSPSKGQLAEIKDPVALAEKYIEGGAKMISVLTDSHGFGGSPEELKLLAEKLKGKALFLRKDFIIDPIQLAESVRIGADAVLLIVTLLQERTKEMVALCKNLGLGALVEIHNEEELKIAIDAGAEMIGINTRNLKSFEIDKTLPEKLLPLIPEGIVKIAESGIQTPDDAKRYLSMGFDAVLIGETLVKEKDPAAFIRGIYAR